MELETCKDLKWQAVSLGFTFKSMDWSKELSLEQSISKIRKQPQGDEMTCPKISDNKSLVSQQISDSQY